MKNSLKNSTCLQSKVATPTKENGKYIIDVKSISVHIQISVESI